MCAENFMCLHRWNSRVHRVRYLSDEVWFGQDNYLAIFSLFTVFKGQFLEYNRKPLRTFLLSWIKLSRIFQGCFTVQLSMFSCWFSLSPHRSNSDIISCCFRFVKNFFQLFYFSFLLSDRISDPDQRNFSFLRSPKSLCFQAFPQQRGL